MRRLMATEAASMPANVEPLTRRVVCMICIALVLLVQGYGMDFEERYRNLPYVAALKESLLRKRRSCLEEDEGFEGPDTAVAEEDELMFQ